MAAERELQRLRAIKAFNESLLNVGDDDSGLMADIEALNFAIKFIEEKQGQRMADKRKPMIEIIDGNTGRPPAFEKMCQIGHDYGLDDDLIDQLALASDGQLVLLGICSDYAYIDKDEYNLHVRFNVED